MVDYTQLIPDLPESWINYMGEAPSLDTEEGYASDDDCGSVASIYQPRTSRRQRRLHRQQQTADEEEARMQAYLAPDKPCTSNCSSPPPVQSAPTELHTPTVFTAKEIASMTEEKFWDLHILDHVLPY